MSNSFLVCEYGDKPETSERDQEQSPPYPFVDENFPEVIIDYEFESTPNEKNVYNEYSVPDRASTVDEKSIQAGALYNLSESMFCQSSLHNAADGKNSIATEETITYYGYNQPNITLLPAQIYPNGSVAPEGTIEGIASGTSVAESNKKSTKQKKLKSYTEGTIHTIVDQVRNRSMSLYHASKYHGIPRATLQYRLSSRYKNKGTRGPWTILTDDEEIKIVSWLQEMARKGFPITRNALVIKVSSYLRSRRKPNPCRDDIPGRRWVTGFMHRHPELSLRTPEGVTSASSKVSEQDIRNWFTSVHEYLVENGLDDALKDPSRILNGDETGFCVNPPPKRVIATKGSKNVPYVESRNSKQNITVLFSFAADGTVIPPDVILPCKRISREIVQSFPGDWGLGTSDSGWMDSKNFALYISKVLYPTLIKKGVKFPVLYFVDGHKSHTALEAADVCIKLGIILIALYPNATRLLQPADVAIFRPLKYNWSKVVEIWQNDQQAEILTIPTFGKLLQKAMDKAFKNSTIMNGFRTCGLYPYNPDAVDYSKCLARGATFKENSTENLEEEMNYDPPSDDDNVNVLIPSKVLRQVRKMIGEERMQELATNTNISSRDEQVLAYVVNNILSVGYQEGHSLGNQQDHSAPIETKETNLVLQTYNIETYPLSQELDIAETPLPDTHSNETTNSMSKGIDEETPLQSENVSDMFPAYSCTSPTFLPASPNEQESDSFADIQKNEARDFEILEEGICDTFINLPARTPVLDDITNYARKRTHSISEFLKTPDTPKRNPSERMEEMQTIEHRKQTEIKERIEKAELRNKNKLEKLKEAQRKKERSALRAAIRAEEKKKKEEIRKQKQEEREKKKLDVKAKRKPKLVV